jgi:hypothetical protein
MIYQHTNKERDHEIARLINTHLHQQHVQRSGTADASRFGFEYLADAVRHVTIACARGRERRSCAHKRNDVGPANGAREIQVVGATQTDRDTATSPIDLCIVGQRRRFQYEVTALDEHIGRGERKPVAARRVSGKEADVGLLIFDRIDGAAALPNMTSSIATPSRSVNARARSIDTPTGSALSGWMFARIGLSTLVEARGVPLHASAETRAAAIGSR